jgi:hypothetical protein
VRASFTFALANENVSSELRMKLTGHKTEGEHQKYTHHEMDNLRAAIKKYRRSADFNWPQAGEISVHALRCASLNSDGRTTTHDVSRGEGHTPRAFRRPRRHADDRRVAVTAPTCRHPSRQPSAPPLSEYGAGKFARRTSSNAVDIYDAKRYGLGR